MAHPDEGTGAPVAIACVVAATPFVPGEFAVAELEQPEHPKARARARAETGPAHLFAIAFVMGCSEPHGPEIRLVDIGIWGFPSFRLGRTPDPNPIAGGGQARTGGQHRLRFRAQSKDVALPDPNRRPPGAAPQEDIRA
ncbi:MAG: hypothetical protein IVW52_09350 [Acidimicrobiales bacterium]|nr:hypothetical protein [Acidimicrobiales bacterium]